MPYGIKNEKPEQTHWMERCVTGVMEGNPGYEKSRAIAICKGNLKKHGWKVPKKSDSELSMYEEMREFEKKLREAFMGPENELKPTNGPWIEDIYDEYAIVRKGEDCWKVPYTMDGESITVSWNKAVKVKRTVVWEKDTDEEYSSKTVNNGRIVTYGGRTV